MANYDLDYEGSVVQDILDTGKSLEDDGYIFLGTATPSTIPGTPTERVAYVGGPGTYNNFGTTVVVPSGGIVVITYSGSAWSKTVINPSADGYVYAGIATAETNPGTPTGKVFYIATTVGTYTHFGNISVSKGINILKYNGTAWSKDVAIQIIDAPTENSEALVTAGGVYNALAQILGKLAEGYIYAGIATAATNPGTPTGKVFYIATAAGTYTNFGGLVVTAGINVLKFDGANWSQEQLIGIDDVPTAGSDNLVKSGGVQNELALGAVYDVSAKNPTAGPDNDGKFESLSALLSDANLNTLIPTAVRKGGMSIKFVQSSDNKYVQFRLKKKTWSIEIFDWVQEDNEENAISFANIYFNTVPLLQGTLDPNTGLPDGMSTRVTTKYYIPSGLFIKVNSGYVIVGVYKFKPNNDNSFDFVSYTYYQNITQLSVSDEGFVFRFIFGKSDNSDLSPSENIINILYSHDTEKIKSVVSDYELKMANASDGRYWNLSGAIGSAVSLSPVQLSNVDSFRCCDEIPVKAGDIFILTTKGGSNGRSYALTDKSRSILSKADANAYCLGQIITVSQDGFLFVNCGSEMYNMFSLKKKYSAESIEKNTVNLFDYKSYGLKTGAYWLTSGTDVTDIPQADNNYAYSNEIPVKNGDVFLLTTQGGSDARAYALTDNDKNIIAVAGANAFLYNQDISITEDGFLFVNCNVDFIDRFSLQKKNFEGNIDGKISGEYKLLTAIETIPNSLFDYKGDIISSNGFEIKVFAAKKDCVYRILSRVGSTSTKADRAFALMYKDSVLVGPVPLGLPIYSVDGDFTIRCDGSFNKIHVYGFTGSPKVCEKTIPVFDNTDYDRNGISLIDEKPLDIMQGASLVAMVQHWGFIGDSFISGCFEYKENGTTKAINNDYTVSPPQIMMRINGCEGYNFSMGGETAKQWCGGLTGHNQDADREWIENGDCKIKTELKQAYYIQLGSNDAISGGISIGSLDTDVDPTDYHNNADTFAGWYAGVIQRVLSVNPKAYFIISTLRLTHAVIRRMNASNIIRAIPQFFKDNGITDRIFVIDQEKYGLDWNAPGNAPYYNGGHPTALGQYYIATWLNTYIDNVIRQNMIAFNEIQFVGTNKQYNEWDWPHSV